MSKIIGIDLGTTNSVVAVQDGAEAKVIVNAEGARTTPSVVAFTADGDRIVGRAARGQAATNPERTIASIKRFVGRRHSEVASEEKAVPYKLVGGPDELVKVDVDGHQYVPPEISAMVLRDLKKSAEAYLGETVTEAVITVPAYFNDAQRQATKEAGEIAGLKVKRIINEPTAAALAYGLQEKCKKGQRVAVFDLGGGTFDISVLDIGEGVFEVLATNGDTHLGGDDWDRALVDFVADEFAKQHHMDLRKDSMALQRLTEACEKAKCDLSSLPQVDINIPYIASVNGSPVHLVHKMTRAQMEHVTAPLFARLSQPVLQCLADAKVTAADIDEVVLVGGSTRTPRVQEICKQLFNGKEPHKGVNPDEVVAIGAAIQGGVLTGDVRDVVLLDVTPLSLGMQTLGGVMTTLIPRNTTIPTQKTEVFTTVEDNQPAVDIHVLQGERRMARDNRTLGKFTLMGIPPSGRGVPKIAVTFDIDVNGILSVHAKDQGTGKEQRIEIRASSGLDKSQVQKLVDESAKHEAEDKAKADAAEARNKLDNLCYAGDKLLGEAKGRVPPPTREAADAALSAARKSLGDGAATAAVLDKAAESLSFALHKVSEALYGAATGEQQAAAPMPTPEKKAPPMPPPLPPQGTPPPSTEEAFKP